MVKILTLALLSTTLIATCLADAKDDYLSKIRKELGVYSFTSPDYPAAFTIVAGISIILVIAVVFVVVGLLTADPGKDSIIYRMTTTRMKKD